MNGLYIHCPFCASKCHYCDFYSVTNGDNLMDAFVDAVVVEARSREAMSFHTVYVGGGTPSLLGAVRLKTLFRELGRIFDLTAVIEGTIEVNPESASLELLETALALGLNRVSVGVQSLSDGELRGAGRIHTAAQAIGALNRVRTVGFRNVSADLIVGLPGQNWHSLRQNLTSLTNLGVNHVSAYCLSLEPGTFLAANQPHNLPSDDIQAGLFEKARSFLTKRGYRHYEISNFAFDGLECQHNLNYWRGGEYVGLGPGAASHVHGCRYRNREDLRGYLLDPCGQTEEVEQLGPARKAAEDAMLGLRLLTEGLKADNLVSRYGEANTSGVMKALEDLWERGLVIREDSRYRLPTSRVLTSNDILASLMG